MLLKKSIHVNAIHSQFTRFFTGFFSVAFVFYSQLYLAFMLLNDQEYLLEEFN